MLTIHFGYINHTKLPSPEIIMKAKTSVINAFLDPIAWEAIKQKWTEIKRVESFDVNFGQHALYCEANVKN